tara:strand:- start:1102 stop:2139 length:1038 start_codon:yes stop_codon:yes gene_type:complete
VKKTNKINDHKDFKNSKLDFNFSNFSKSEIVNFLISMSLIRAAEVKLAESKRDGLIGGPVHLGVGQEAIAVGLANNLSKNDRVFGAHRSHSHILSLNQNIRSLFAEVLGKSTGFSKGLGGSMHLWNADNGFYGSVPIVAGTVPLAVGAGLAAKLQGIDSIGVSYLGDGAIEEGIVHESLNFSRISNIPVLFVLENNYFSSHMHINLRQPSDSTIRFAEANKIKHQLVDGNNVLSVANASNELINYIRKNKSPAFLEAVTYRWYGHVDWREDIDVGLERSKKDIAEWKAKDPIQNYSNAMIKNKLWSQSEQKELEITISNKINTSWEQAIKDPYPSKDSLMNNVYG